MSFEALYRVIQDKSTSTEPTSYTANIFRKGIVEMAKKLGEEGVEVAIAAIAQSDDRLVEESIDLIYHLFCIFVERGISLSQLDEEIVLRMRSGKDKNT